MCAGTECEFYRDHFAQQACYQVWHSQTGFPFTIALQYLLCSGLTFQQIRVQGQSCDVRLGSHVSTRAGASGKQKADRRRPASVMRALHLCLSGRADQAHHWVPPLATCAAACVRRTADVLAFYECIASSSGERTAPPCSSCFRNLLFLHGFGYAALLLAA